MNTGLTNIGTKKISNVIVERVTEVSLYGNMLEPLLGNSFMPLNDYFSPYFRQVMVKISSIDVSILKPTST